MTTPTDDRTAVSQIISSLLADGWGLTMVYDGVDEIAVTTPDEAISAIFAVGQAYLHVTREQERGWVWFVLGNEPAEVAANYTANLDPVIDNLTTRWWK